MSTDTTLPTPRLRLGRDADGLHRHHRRLHPGGHPRAGARRAARETIRGTIGLGLRETIDILIPGCDEELFGRILECYRKHWVSTYRDPPLLFDGVRGDARGSWPSDGYLLAVATGKSRRGLDYALEQTGLGDLFHATRTVDEAFSKPHPQMLLDILDELGVRAAGRGDDRRHHLRPGDGEERAARPRWASAPARTCARSCCVSSPSPAWSGWWSWCRGWRSGAARCRRRLSDRARLSLSLPLLPVRDHHLLRSATCWGLGGCLAVFAAARAFSP